MKFDKRLKFKNNKVLKTCKTSANMTSIVVRVDISNIYRSETSFKTAREVDQQVPTKGSNQILKMKVFAVGQELSVLRFLTNNDAKAIDIYQWLLKI